MQENDDKHAIQDSGYLCYLRGKDTEEWNGDRNMKIDVTMLVMFLYSLCNGLNDSFPPHPPKYVAIQTSSVLECDCSRK